MKKRILSLLLALVMVLSLAACGAQNDSPQTSDTNKQDAETTADETHMDVEDSDFFVHHPRNAGDWINLAQMCVVVVLWLT